MSRLSRTLIRGAGWLSGILFVVSGIGLSFWLRGPTLGWPGPRIGDALPLSELAGTDRMPLIVFLFVWVIVATALGLIARAGRVERLTAAAVLTMGVGLELYLIDVLCLYLVRELPAHSAFAAAAGIRAIYLPAALAGTAGAILGRRRGDPGRAPYLLAALVGTAGALGILSAVTSPTAGRLHLLRRFAPAIFPPLANAAVAAAGLVLILVARGLSRRKRRAWTIAVVLLAGSSLFHLLKGLDFEEAIVVALIALALVARRNEFDRPGDPSSSRRALGRAAIFAVAIYVFGVAALFLHHFEHARRPFSIVHALAVTSHALTSPHLPAGDHLRGWFAFSLDLLVIAGALAALTAWLAPWRLVMWQSAAQRARARALVRRWGSDSLAPFTLRADKTWFFDKAQESFLAYRVVGGVAFVSGDPVGPPGEETVLVRDFLDFARGRGWQVAILGASERNIALYEGLGLRALYWGDEAVIDTATFSLEGRSIRKTRQSVHRLERAGFTAEVLWAGDVPHALAGVLTQIESAWRGDKPRRGNTMEMDELFHLGGRAALFVIGRDASGDPCGFLHFATCRAGSTLSLSSMPRLPSTPNGFNEWLIAQAVAWARCNGFTQVSLNFSPFARLLSGEEAAAGIARITRDALLAVKSRLQLQLDNLYVFNQKFLPRWCPRYVVYERRAHLPRIGVAALAAEGYLRRNAV